MRNLTLTKQQARVLGLNLEAKAQGYSHKELRRLDAVMDVIDAALGEYQTRIERIAAKSRRERRDATDQAELVRIAGDEARAVEAVNEEDGKTQVTLLLEEAQYEFAKDHWEAMNSFRGDRESRQLVLAISEAVTGAESVKAKTVDKAKTVEALPEAAP